MANLARLTNNLTPTFNDNLIVQKLNYNVASGGGNFTHSLSSLSFANTDKSIYLTSNNSNPIVLNINYNCVAKEDGLQGFSFSALKLNESIFEIALKVYKNASEIALFETTNSEIHNVWETYGQTFLGNKGDIFTFQLEVSANDINKAILFSGFKFELLNKGFSMPSVYSLPIIQKTGWISRADTTNLVSLTANAENIVQITGIAESNGGLNLLDANSKIQAINQGDEILIDFSCTFETPVGADNLIDVLLKVGNNVYRGFTYILSKGEGIDDYFSVSWSIPCGAEVVANGAEIVLIPNKTMNYKNRYIKVSRTHEAI